MGIKTTIEYVDSSCNPTPWCSGCELYRDDMTKNHCYAAALQNRYGKSGKHKGFPRSFTRWTPDEMDRFGKRVAQACKWKDLTGTVRDDKPWLKKMPRVIFFNDLGDSFASILPPDWALKHLQQMETSPHIWLWLTKWPSRMLEFFLDVYDGKQIPHNFVLGTTLVDQNHASRMRLHHIARFPEHFDRVHLFLSLEPMLGPIRLNEMIWNTTKHYNLKHLADAVTDGGGTLAVAAGGESGPNKRRFQLGWAKQVLDECEKAQVPFFMKQIDKVRPIPDDLLVRELPKWA